LTKLADGERVTPHLKNATVADLQIEFRALYLIAAPKTPSKMPIPRNGRLWRKTNPSDTHFWDT
jgi:hypothetical protein